MGVAIEVAKKQGRVAFQQLIVIPRCEPKMRLPRMMTQYCLWIGV
jgi:hypothetical protein